MSKYDSPMYDDCRIYTSCRSFRYRSRKSRSATRRSLKHWISRSGVWFSRLSTQKNRIVEDTSIDSFISGFELAWKLSMELNNYENEHSVSCRTAKKLCARFTFKKEEEQ